MIDRRFWSGAIAVVTLIVAGSGALPELLLRPAPTGPAVVLPVSAPKVEPIAKPEQTAALEQATPVVHTASVPAVNRAEISPPPEQSTAGVAPQSVAAVIKASVPEPEIPAAPALAPPVAFPPVQPVGVAAANAQDVVPPTTNPQVRPANSARPVTDKPVQSEPTGRRPVKPGQNVRPEAYPIGEFLAWRR